MTNFLCIAVVAIVLVGCSQRHAEPTVTFKKTECMTKPLEQTRTRRVASHCLVHHRYYNSAMKMTMNGACMAWAYRTVHDRMYNESCSHDYWSRDLER
jgi:PBP1b-binding outer membrane lipoprotein LpoB